MDEGYGEVRRRSFDFGLNGFGIAVFLATLGEFNRLEEGEVLEAGVGGFAEGERSRWARSLQAARA